MYYRPMKSKLDQKGEESPESSAKSQTMVNAMEGAGTAGKGKDHLNSMYICLALSSNLTILINR